MNLINTRTIEIKIENKNGILTVDINKASKLDNSQSKLSQT